MRTNLAQLKFHKIFDVLVTDKKIGLIGAAIIGVIVDKYGNAESGKGTIVSKREIARSLRLSPRTVLRHLGSLIAIGVLEIYPAIETDNIEPGPRGENCNWCDQLYYL